MNKKMFLSLVLVSVMGIASVSASENNEAGRLTRWANSGKELAGAALETVKGHPYYAAATVAALVGVVVVYKKCTKTAQEETEETWETESVN